MRIQVGSSLVLLSTLACSSAAKPSTTFPPGFVFGIASAGFQVEMGCPTIPASECNDPNSDWYQWITDPKIAADAKESIVGGGPTTGPGFYELFPEDLARAKNDLHVSAVRLGIEWSRIFPTTTKDATGYDALKAIASKEGVAFYHRLFAELKKDGLTPLVTLNHYTLPTWVHDGVACHESLDTCAHKGWLDASTITEIAKYAGFIGKEFGGEVDLWATENEPLAVVLAGYLQPGKTRSNPPGLLLHSAEAKTVLLALIEAHARMYDAVKANDTVDIDGDGKASQIGLVYNMAPVFPSDPANPDDVQAAKNIFYLYDELFLNAIIKGKLDDKGAGAEGAKDRPDLARMDYLGLNYYNRITLVGTTTSFLQDFSPLATFDPFNEKTSFFEVYPKGIYEMIKFASQAYPNLPIYITENGTAQGADAASAPQDCARYLQWTQKAISEGADVRGYFWWTLTDNYEWNHGMDDQKFGLFAVDSHDPKKPRTLRPLGETYAKIVQARQVPDDLAKLYPIQ